jgi:hypothetical protein
LWDVPVGKSHPLNFNNNVWANALLGGWQLGGVLNAHTGLPINVLDNRPNVLYQYVGSGPYNGSYYSSPVFYNATTGAYTGAPAAGYTLQTIAVDNIPGGGQSRGTQRPNVVAGVNPYLNSSSGFILNPAAFSVPLAGTYGNMQRYSLSGLGFNQLDLTLSKRFLLTERSNLELRAEFYNILNHPNFGNPGSVVLNAATPSGPTSTSASIQPGQAYTTKTAGAAFGSLTSTVGQYVGLGTNRQIQLALRLTF